MIKNVEICTSTKKNKINVVDACIGGQSLTRAYRTHTYSTLEWEIIPIIQLLHYIHY